MLARMARFIVADLIDPSSIPKELEAIVPDLAVPVQPLLEGGFRRFGVCVVPVPEEHRLPISDLAVLHQQWDRGTASGEGAAAMRSATVNTGLRRG